MSADKIVLALDGMGGDHAPEVVVNGDVMSIVKVAVPLPVTSIVASLFWTFPAGVASDPPFAAG